MKKSVSPIIAKFSRNKKKFKQFIAKFSHFFSFAKEIRAEFRGKSKNFRFPHFAGNPRDNPLKCF